MIFNNKHSNNQTNSKSPNLFKFVNNYNYTTKEITRTVFKGNINNNESRPLIIIKNNVKKNWGRPPNSGPWGTPLNSSPGGNGGCSDKLKSMFSQSDKSDKKEFLIIKNTKKN